MVERGGHRAEREERGEKSTISTAECVATPLMRSLALAIPANACSAPSNAGCGASGPNVPKPDAAQTMIRGLMARRLS